MAKCTSLYVFHPNLLRTSAFSIKLGKHLSNSNCARVRVAGSSAEIDNLVVRSQQQFGGRGDGQILARQDLSTRDRVWSPIFFEKKRSNYSVNP